MADVIDGMKFEQKHGKERVRVGRVWRNDDGSHSFVEWNVSITLFSDCVASYVRDDNSDIVATDTMKNTVPSGVTLIEEKKNIVCTVLQVYVKAKECKQQLSPEDFAIVLAKHFTSFYKQVTAALVKIVEKPWKRVYINGQPHNHGFELGSEKHMTEVVLKKSGDLKITSGVQALSVLKTTQSGFESFIRDKYTILPDTRERMLATEVTATWRYPFQSLGSVPSKPGYFNERYDTVKRVLLEVFFGPPKGVYSPSVQSTLYQMAKVILARFQDIESIELKMPNIHFIPVNLSSKENPAMVKFADDVYLPTDEPHGSIQASLTRLWSRL